MPKLGHRKGYTLIEILIVMAIMGLILVFGTASYQDFNNRQKIKIAQQTILNDLRYARSMATNGRKPEGCRDNLEGYMFGLVGGLGTGTYSVYPVCVLEDGSPGSCDGPGCESVTRTVTLSGISLSVVPTSDRSILFYTLGRGTSVDTVTLRIAAPLISGDIRYEIEVNTAGSISIK